jgi:hypothetical protein
MKTESVKLSKLILNKDNPRIITVEAVDDIVKSLLCFPEMYSLRPMVIKDNYPIGGNVRLKGFNKILKMSLNEIAEIIGKHSKDNSKERIEYLVDLWQKFQSEKTVEICRAENLTEEQIKEFIIGDNVSIGSWDFDVLANWNTDDLTEWGLELPVWGDGEDINGQLSKDPFDDPGIAATDKYGVVVMCENASDQEIKYNALLEMGYKCRVIVV